MLVPYLCWTPKGDSGMRLLYRHFDAAELSVVTAQKMNEVTPSSTIAITTAQPLRLASASAAEAIFLASWSVSGGVGFMINTGKADYNV